MSLSQFIKDNRVQIDAYIHKIAPNVSLNDKDRREWILNDEKLYLWAKRERIHI